MKLTYAQIGEKLAALEAKAVQQNKAKDPADRAYAERLLGDIRDKKRALVAANRSVSIAAGTVFEEGGDNERRGTGATDKAVAELVEKLKARGFTDAAIAGTIGNLVAESKFEAVQEGKPTISGSRGGFGILQWTGSRRKAFESWADENGKDSNNLSNNVDFLIEEMDGKHGGQWTDGGNIADYKKIDDPEQASLYLENKYVRPGIPHTDKRIKYSKDAFESLSNSETPDVKKYDGKGYTRKAEVPLTAKQKAAPPAATYKGKGMRNARGMYPAPGTPIPARTPSTPVYAPQTKPSKAGPWNINTSNGDYLMNPFPSGSLPSDAYNFVGDRFQDLYDLPKTVWDKIKPTQKWLDDLDKKYLGTEEGEKDRDVKPFDPRDRATTPEEILKRLKGYRETHPAPRGSQLPAASGEHLPDTLRLGRLPSVDPMRQGKGVGPGAQSEASPIGDRTLAVNPETDKSSTTNRYTEQEKPSKFDTFAKYAAPMIDNIAAAGGIRNLEAPPAPVLDSPINLNNEYNINSALAENQKSVRDMVNGAMRNSGNASQIAATQAYGVTARIQGNNQLFGQKYNYENDSRNREATFNAGINSQNTNRVNQYLELSNQFRNNKTQMTAQNYANLGQDVQDTMANDRRYEFERESMEMYRQSFERLNNQRNNLYR